MNIMYFLSWSTDMIKKPRYTLNELARLHAMPRYEYLRFLNDQEYASFLLSTEDPPHPTIDDDNCELPIFGTLPSKEVQK